MSRRKTSGHEDLFEKIQRIWMFRACRPDELRQIAKVAAEVQVQAGHVIVREGAPPRELIALSDGRAVASVRGAHASLLMPGSTFGEAALLGYLPSGATLTTVTDCRLFVIEARAFRALVQIVPTVGSKLLCELARRVPAAS